MTLCMSNNNIHSELDLLIAHYILTHDLPSPLQAALLEIFVARNIMVLQRHWVLQRIIKFDYIKIFLDGI